MKTTKGLSVRAAACVPGQTMEKVPVEAWWVEGLSPVRERGGLTNLRTTGTAREEEGR